MNYHGRIMNIERDPMLVAGAPTDAAYFYGHRDARHAAAEIASKADAEIDRLRAEIALLTDANRHQDEMICEQAAQIARLREALAIIAHPVNIGKLYHMDAVTQARAALSQESGR